MNGESLTKKPWTLDGSNSIKDASGNTIGSFKDWREAEHCVESVNDYENIDALRAENEHLDSVNDDLAGENESLKAELGRLKTP